MLAGADGIGPGEDGLVRLRLPVAVPLLPGDRYVLRESGRDETVGGGEVLDVAPVLAARRARPTRSVDRVVAERGWVLADELERVTGERREPQVGRWVVAPEALVAAESDLRAAIEGAGPLGLDVAGLDERRRAVLARLDGVVVEGGRVRAAAAADPLADHPYVAALEAGRFSPPDPDGVDRAELSELVRRGLVIERDGVYFAPSAVAEAARLRGRGPQADARRDHRGPGPRRPRHDPQARPAPTGPPRRHRRHPPKGRRPHSRPKDAADLAPILAQGAWRARKATKASAEGGGRLSRRGRRWW